MYSVGRNLITVNDIAQYNCLLCMYMYMSLLVQCLIGDTPTLLKLDSLDVIKGIAAGDYHRFGMHLLNDENGVEVDVIVKDYTYEGVESITRAILKKWLTSDASRTYQQLIECLNKSGLNAVAKHIAHKASEGMHDSYNYIIFFVFFGITIIIILRR